MLAAVILSGGSSSRMGSPKALLPYQGRPFLDHLLEITRHPEIGVRRVVLGAHAEPDRGEGAEPLVGTYAILDLVPNCRDEGGLPFPMSWVRHHDKYEQLPHGSDSCCHAKEARP